MNALAIVAALVVLAGLDGAFAGFRASCGRSGLVRHTVADRVAAVRGLAVLAGLLVPAVLLGAVVAARAGLPPLVAAGRGLLVVTGPYGLLVLAALTAYLGLDWRRRFLASAVLLGPLTLARPLVVAAGVVVAAAAADDAAATAVSVLAGAAVLGVEPLVGRLWYAPDRALGW